MHSKAKRPTKEQSYRMAAIKRIGICMACYSQGNETRGTVEIHHLLECGRRLGHSHTIGLCEWHHRGEPGAGMAKKSQREFFGPALSDGTRLFRGAYGSDASLLAMQNQLIEELQ